MEDRLALFQALLQTLIAAMDTSTIGYASGRYAYYNTNAFDGLTASPSDHQISTMLRGSILHMEFHIATHIIL